MKHIRKLFVDTLKMALFDMIILYFTQKLKNNYEIKYWFLLSIFTPSMLIYTIILGLFQIYVFFKYLDHAYLPSYFEKIGFKLQFYSIKGVCKIQFFVDSMTDSMDMAKLITQNEVKYSFSDHVCLYNKLMITMNSVFMMRYKLTVIEIS